MKYKALMFDVDGTLVVNDPKAVPTPAVTSAVRKAATVLPVCLATGRGLHEVDPVLYALDVSGLCILDHGALIYDVNHKKIVREVALSKTQVQQAYQVFRSVGLPVYFFDDPSHTEYLGNEMPRSVLGLWSRGATAKESALLEAGFAKIENITINKTKSWDGIGLSFEITHADATKQHGVLEVAKLLHIDPSEIIGVGDGYNDYSLLMACGLKIAMGNAIPELKAIADFIAPSVEEDGVVTIIEKFILP